MKKQLLFLIAILALVGCSRSESEISAISNQAENNSTEFNSASDTYINTESVANLGSDTSIEAEPFMSMPGITARYKIVNFQNGGFTSSSLDQAASQKQFVDWFNGEDDVLESINYEGYAQLNYIGDPGDSWRFSTLILGSQKSSGKITFNLKFHPASISVMVQPYTKYIEYSNSYSIDRNATFMINEKEYDLSVPDSNEGETEVVNIKDDQLDGDKYSFSIANKEAGQRVFVHSIVIIGYADFEP